jgi:RNA polymerase sigma-70 factor (ECF subfamily)
MKGRWMGVEVGSRTRSEVPTSFPQDVTPAERELVERARKEPEAFGHLYEDHYHTILTFLHRNTSDVSLAEELTSRTFFKALRALPKYAHRQPFRLWLYAIAANEMRMHWRAEKTRRSALASLQHDVKAGRVRFHSGESQADLEDRMRRYSRVVELLGALPEKYRIPLSLRYIESLRLEEIASITGKRLGTVKSLLHRGMKLLRKRAARKDATLPPPPHLSLVEGGKQK